MLARTLGVIGASALVFAVASPASAQTWNPSTDYQSQVGSNPYGPWSMGSADALGDFTALNLYHASGQCGASAVVDCWYGENSNNGVTAEVVQNLSTTRQSTDGGHWFGADSVGMQADASDAVVRWTAPTNGVFDVSGSFTCQSGACTANNGTYVLEDGTTLFQSTNFGGVNDATFSFSDLTMTAGETIDFFVQNEPGQSNVEATLAAQITEENTGGGGTTTTPEPSSIALLGTGLIGLVPVMRRRRRK